MSNTNWPLRVATPREIILRSRDTRPYTLPEMLGRHPLRTTDEVALGVQEAVAALELNTKNRPMDMHRAEEFSRLMLNGLWFKTEDPISFTNQELANGQTRMMALVLAATACPDIQVPFNLRVGIAPEVMLKATDNGRPRSTSQNLKLAAVSRAPEIAAAARLLVLYMNEVYTIPKDSMLYLPTARTHCSTAKVMHAISEYPELRESLEYVCSLSNYKLITTVNVLAVMHFLGKEAATLNPPTTEFVAAYPQFSYSQPEFSQQIVNEFMARLVDGIGLQANTPILKLRDKLLRVKQEAAGRGSTRLPTDKLAMCIRAWNAWRRNPTASFEKVYGISTSGSRQILMPEAK